MDETLTAGAEIELDVPADQAWAAVGTPEGLEAWLAPEVALPAVEPGAAGRLVDDQGVARRISIQRVDPGRSVTFTWWRDDDPAEASTVSVLLVPVDERSSRVRVVETTVARASARATAATWSGRLADLAPARLAVRAGA